MRNFFSLFLADAATKGVTEGCLLFRDKEDYSRRSLPCQLGSQGYLFSRRHVLM